MSYAQPSQRTFVGIVALLFAASTTLTVAWCHSMSSMHDMPMPGGWSMSMTWMRMPGQTWPGVVLAFLGMWLSMMVAMMLPSLMPMLSRYREAVGSTAGARLGTFTVLAGAGYFFVWTMFGVLVFFVGMTIADFEMHLSLLARAAPIATGAIVLIAGALQFSRWKARHLACCRSAPHRDTLAANARAAWRHGLRLGVHCVHCCCGLTVILLAVGMMNLCAMAFVTAAISVERLAPNGLRAAQFTGLLLVAAGAMLMVRAAAA